MRTRLFDDWLIAPKQRLRDQLAAHVRSRRLDEALAHGSPAEASAAIALRARRLTDVRYRRTLARTIRRLVRETDSAASASWSRIRPLRWRVAAAADTLSELADELAQPNPVSPRGVAQAVILLTDGTGPLFNAHRDEDLRDRAAAAVANLRIATAYARPWPGGANR